MGWIENLFRKPFRIRSSKNEHTTVSLDSFNTKFVQSLYRNNNEKYAFSGGFVKPIIDTAVGYVGIPQIVSESEAAKDFNSRKSTLMSIIRDAMLESRVYVRIDFVKDSLYSSQPKMDISIIDDTRVIPLFDVYGKIQGYRVTTDVVYDATDRNRTYKKHEYIYSDGRIVTEIEGSAPKGAEFQAEDARFSICTIIPIVNEPDKYGKGMSDIEPLIPYLAIYHQIMNHANQYKNLHSEPKIKMKIKDWKLFQQMNAGIIDKDGNISLENGIMYAIGVEDDIAYISAPSAMGDFTSLLNYVFLCLVQASQTPEWIMGGAIQSSKASAETQTAIMEVKTSRKRTLFHDQFIQLYKVFAYVYDEVHGTTTDVENLDIRWENVEISNIGEEPQQNENEEGDGNDGK